MKTRTFAIHYCSFKIFRPLFFSKATLSSWLKLLNILRRSLNYMVSLRKVTSALGIKKDDIWLIRSWNLFPFFFIVLAKAGYSCISSSSYKQTHYAELKVHVIIRDLLCICALPERRAEFAFLSINTMLRIQKEIINEIEHRSSVNSAWQDADLLR